MLTVESRFVEIDAAADKCRLAEVENCCFLNVMLGTLQRLKRFQLRMSESRRCKRRCCCLLMLHGSLNCQA